MEEDDRYVPALVAFDEAERLEYVIKDVPVVERRIDDRLSILLDMDTRLPVGFQLMGWRDDLGVHQ